MPSSKPPPKSKNARKGRASAPNLGARTFLVVILVAAAAVGAVLQPLQLGLDLRGGTQIVMEAVPTADAPLDDDTVDRTLEVLRRRVDALGVTEPTLQRSGDRRVIIELPGVTDPEDALAVIGRTAQLTFHPVLGQGDEGEVLEADPEDPGASARIADEDGEVTLLDDSELPIRIGPVALTGEEVEGANIGIGQAGSAFQVGVDFRGSGESWRELTAEAACAPPGDPQRRIAIVLDNTVVSSPQVETTVACGQGIAGGGTSITGDFTEEEAEELALVIRAGALPVPVEVAERRVIGPTLGANAIEASLTAAAIGVSLTLLFLIAAYRLYGLVAGLVLAVYGVLTYAALGALGAVLTLPGIAGFVLAIGMAVDANVLVFERAKEEHDAGKSPRTATKLGFTKAFTAVIDSNVTTIIAAMLLFFLASGAVQGYGVTLSLGVLMSMFSALVASRVIIDWMLRSPRLASKPHLLGLTAWRAVRRWLEEHQPDLMGRSRTWLTGSAVAIVLVVAGFFVQGISWGLEFTGGQLLEYETERPVDPEELRAELLADGLPNAVVQSTGDEQIAIRSPELTPEEVATVVATVQDLGGSTEIIREEFVGPTIGSELRRNALIALGVAIVGQLLYLAIRFRWTYGLATVLAMFHDAVIVVGAFVWLGRTLDGVFLAALLTVIGYSTNDSVVIFDRVRERHTDEPDRPLAEVTNEACLQTLPRTVNTGTGAWFILLALLVLGGDTLTDFALALLLGTLVATYSSIMVGAPLFLRFEAWDAPRRAAREQAEEDQRRTDAIERRRAARK